MGKIEEVTVSRISGKWYASGRFGWIRIKASKLSGDIEASLPPAGVRSGVGLWHFATGALIERAEGQSIKTACGHIATSLKSQQEWARPEDIRRIEFKDISAQVCRRCAHSKLA